MSISKEPIIQPLDKYNQELVSNVHPPDWVNPEPVERYDLVVVGAGTAGLVVAAGAAGLGLGLKIALIEKHLMGGDCLNVGCVPSKSIIRSSRIVGDILNAEQFGIYLPDRIDVDFPAVMQRMRRIRASISPNDSAQRFQKLGVDVFLGEGRFISRSAIEVDGNVLNFKKAAIATGARAAHPKIKGLADAGFLTNETVFSLTERPQRLAVIGAGPIGCELAQSFRRLGSEVTLLHKNDRVLNQEDVDAAKIVQQTFLQEGIQLVLNCQLTQIEKTPEERLFTSAPTARKPPSRLMKFWLAQDEYPTCSA